MSAPVNRFDQMMLKEGLYPELLKAQMIDQDGRIVKVDLNFPSYFYDLEIEEQKDIEQEFLVAPPIYTRCSIKLQGVSTGEVAIATQVAARSMVGSEVCIRFHGRALRRCALRTMCRLFKVVSTFEISTLPSVLLKRKIQDRDWIFLLEDCFDQERWNQIVERSLISPLKEKADWGRIRRSELAFYTAQEHKSALLYPSGTYPHEMAKRFGKSISIKDPDLEHKFIALCAFDKASDVCQTRPSKFSFLRRLSRGADFKADDYSFTNGSLPPSRPIDSIYVDVTHLTDKNTARPLRLASTLGKIGLIQAIFDFVLHNMTFDPNKPATPSDFLRTVLFFTDGGTCLQQGWLLKTFSELQKHAMNLNIPWVKLFASQLISVAKSHCSQNLESLMCLAFNACSLLQWKELATAQEIRDIWRVVFWHMDKITPKGEYPEIDSSPIIESFKICMRGEDCQFKDVQSQVIVSSFFILNALHKNYPCKLRPTEGHLFTRIQIKLIDQECFLFLPFEIVKATDHLKQVYARSAMPGSQSVLRTIELLRDVHNKMIGNTLIFQFGHSDLSDLMLDPRMDRNNILQRTRDLLLLENESSWSMGYLLGLALLSQESDVLLLQLVLKSVFTMLSRTGRRDCYKREVVTLLNAILKKSGFEFNPSIFERLIASKLGPYENLCDLPPEFVCEFSAACLCQNHASFIEIGLHLLSGLSSRTALQSRLKNYKQTIECCIKTDPVPQDALISLISHLMDDIHLRVTDKLLIFLFLYEVENVSKHKEIESTLLKALLRAFSTLQELPKKFLESKTLLEKRMLQIMERQSDKTEPSLVLELFRQLSRFGLFANEITLRNVWEKTIEFAPKGLEYSYLQSMIALAQQYGIWQQLGSAHHSSFLEKFIAALNSEFEKNVDVHPLTTTCELENIDFHKQIHALWLKNVNIRLNEWKSDPIKEEVLYTFLQHLRMLELKWDKKEVLFLTLQRLSNAMLNPPHVKFLQQILEKFQLNNVCESGELSTFWISLLIKIPDDHLGSGAVQIRCLILEQLHRMLLVSSEKKEWNASLSTHFFAEMVKPNTSLSFPCQIVQPFSEPLLECLFSADEWDLILRFIEIPGILNPTKQTFDCLIACCEKIFTQSKSDKKNLLKLKKIATQLPGAILEDSSFSQLDGVCEVVAQLCAEQEDYLGAFKWLSILKNNAKGLSDSFYTTSFETVIKALKNNAMPLACAYVFELRSPPKYAPQWLLIFDVLLKSQESSSVLKLIDNDPTILVMINQDRHRDAVHKLVVELACNAEKLMQFKDSLSQKQFDQVAKLLFHLLSTKSYEGHVIWTQFLQKVIKGASDELLEDIFLRMMKDDLLLKHFPTNRIVEFWGPIFRRFGEKGAPILLQTDIWKDSLNREIGHGLVSEKRLNEIHKSLAKGAVIALKKITPGKPQRDYAKSVYGVFTEKLRKFEVSVSGIDGKFALDLAELTLFKNDEEGFFKTLCSLILVFTLTNSCALDESRALELTNITIEKIMRTTKKDLVNAGMRVIDLVQRSAFCAQGSHFLFLKFVLSHQGTINLQQRREMLGIRFELNLIQRSLESIFSSPIDEIPNTIPLKQLDVVNQGVAQLNLCSWLYGDLLVSWLELPVFKRFIRDGLKKSILKNKDKGSGMKPLLNRVSRNLNILSEPMRRFGIAIQSGYTPRKEWLPAEQRAIKGLKEDFSFLCTRITMVTAAILGLISLVLIAEKMTESSAAILPYWIDKYKMNL